MRRSELEKGITEMTFLEALKTGRPMRRLSTLINEPWLFLGVRIRNTYQNMPQWRRTDTGEEVGLHAFDYHADDWEVMP